MIIAATCRSRRQREGKRQRCRRYAGVTALFRSRCAATISPIVASKERLVDICVDLRLPGKLLRQGKRFQDGAGVILSAAQIVNLRHSRRLGESMHEPRDIQRVDVVAHLLAFIPVDLVLATLEIAFDEVTQKTVQLHARMVRAGQTAPPQATRRQAEIASVFLHQHVRRDL
jgi:hypothetical protein